jgi:thermostable 8-oxoguanine DNA glycosylase
MDIMIHKLRAHHKKRRKEILQRLSEFRKNKKIPSKKFLEEMAFCVFAANSSAKMGLKAAHLLKDVLQKGTLNEYREAVHKKVRFYNKRAEYMHYNKEKVKLLERGSEKNNIWCYFQT